MTLLRRRKQQPPALVFATISAGPERNRDGVLLGFRVNAYVPWRDGYQLPTDTALVDEGAVLPTVRATAESIVRDGRADRVHVQVHDKWRLNRLADYLVERG